MERENVHYSAKGFLKDPAYTADLYNLLCDYKDKFGEAESLTLNLVEIPPGMIDFNNKKMIDISEDGKSVIINLTSQKHTNSKGKTTGTPEPISVYRDIHFVLKKAAKEYEEKFEN